MLPQQPDQHETEFQEPNPLMDLTPVPRGSLIDAAIDQLLKDQPSKDDTDYLSKSREKSDLTRLLHVHVECASGDTLVIVDFPSGYLSCGREEWTQKRFLVHSEKLLATGSKVFANLLSPAKQARLLKRVRLTGETALPKFVIDLTPSFEGDDLAAQLMELSLPPGVTDWWMSKERLDISQYLVSGHDDHCPCHDEVALDCRKKSTYTQPERPRIFLPDIDLDDIEPSESRAIDDYCPIRHRVNIIRLLLAIEGFDLVLNSAPRVYTLTVIANILDCTSVIRDSVYMWLLTEPNSEFIDINTEIAFKIAWTLKIDSITKAAFRILVVERALDTLATQPRAQEDRYTVFGRPRVDLPDDLQTIVQYAAQKLADRVHQTLAKLKSDQFYNTFKISEYQKFMEAGGVIRAALSNTDPSPDNSLPTSEPDGIRDQLLTELLDSFLTLFTSLQEYKDLVLERAMCAITGYHHDNDYDRDRQCYVEGSRRTAGYRITEKFSEAQHLLTPWFWEHLASYAADKEGQCYPDRFLAQYVSDFNNNGVKATSYLYKSGSRENFRLEEFRAELHQALVGLWSSWTKREFEVPLTRTGHIVLGLTEDELQYLPLWAGGLNDGSGGVFQSAVPDADLGPIGPGPAYRTGDTVATDVSSICQSDKTPSDVSTATLTAGRSVNAVPSNIGPSSTVLDDNDGVSVSVSDPFGAGSRNVFTPPSAGTSASSATMDRDDSDGYESVGSDEVDEEEVWSQVGEPL
ncbi:uncharacterized protein F4812DRAFT_437914, partial [Daldinia caldariorum]|uniref:uncharacterized protein n=1 Tax=Daldinia caldariorum TaxID=326644 RepID=UPI002007B037